MYFRSINGELEYPSTDLHVQGSPSFNLLHALRGPFTKTGDFLAHNLRANLLKYETFPAETLAAAVSRGRIDESSEDDVPELSYRAKASQDDHSVADNHLAKSGFQDTRELENASISPAIATRLERAKHVMKKGLELCYFYPGDSLEGDGATPFTIHLDDFRLSNVLVRQGAPFCSRHHILTMLACRLMKPLERLTATSILRLR